MKAKKQDIVYEISVDDLQRVATEVLERKLSDEEIINVEKSLGDCIDWFQAVENAINRCVPHKSTT